MRSSALPYISRIQIPPSSSSGTRFSTCSLSLQFPNSCRLRPLHREQLDRVVFTFTVDDVDAMCGELIGRGVQLLNGPMNRPWGIRTASFLIQWLYLGDRQVKAGRGPTRNSGVAAKRFHQRTNAL